MKEEKNAVACLIYNREKTEVCLIKRRDVPVWVLPGGGIDPGEPAEEAARREADEETQLLCQVKRLVGIYLPKNSLAKKTFLYELIAEGPLAKGSTEETLAAKFFPLNNLPQMPPPYAAWIKDGLSVPEGAINYSFVPGVTWLNFIKFLILHPLKVLRFILARCGLHWNS